VIAQLAPLHSTFALQAWSPSHVISVLDVSPFTSPLHACSPMQRTLQVVAPVQSTLSHACLPVQTTRHGPPGGHFTFLHWVAPGHAITHVSPSHVPRAAPHPGPHVGGCTGASTALAASTTGGGLPPSAAASASVTDAASGAEVKVGSSRQLAVLASSAAIPHPINPRLITPLSHANARVASARAHTRELVILGKTRRSQSMPSCHARYLE
jgi:hypothetical protein